MHEEDYVRALDVADFALALEPHSAGNHRDRGVVHYQLGHSAEALDDLVHYLDLVPNSADAEGCMRSWRSCGASWRTRQLL